MSARARRHRAAAALALALALTAPGAAAAPAEPPFHITADNMTGGRTEAGDVLFLNGNLRVTRGKTVLTADNGRYERSNGLIDLTGNVRLVDSTTTVTCRHATFSENDDRLNLDGDVVIVDREAVLRAPYGWYDRSTGTAHLGGGVTGHEKKQRLSADETTYLRDSMLVKARGNVHGWDDENDVELASQRVDFDRRSRVAVATGGPVMTTRDKDGAVTTMTALLLRLDSARKIAEAVDSVQVTRDTMRVRANRAVFNDSTGHGFLYGSPRAWDNETVVTGDTLETVAVDRRLERVVVHGDAVMDYAGGRADNAGETSRLTGRRVDVFVTRNRIDSLLAVGAARNEYTAPATAGRTQERNLANGDSILVWFKDRKVDRARVVGHAQGEYRSPVDPKDSLAVANEVVKYDGRVIEFVVPKNQIVLEGQAHLTYRELELSSRRVEFDSEKQTLVAQGSPVLLDKGDRVDGHLMTYDLESRTGTIYQAETKYEQGLYRGDRIRKAGENQLDVLHGSYSTCDLDHPHYHFAARQMKIYLKDKLVAKPVVFYLRNVPVLALPFYVFPIKPGRHSGFLFPTFEFGFSNRTGQFLRNAGYYWAINDYMDLSLSGDYYQAQPAWAIRGEGNYKLLYAFDGRFNGRFEHNDATRRDDYVFEADHQQGPDAAHPARRPGQLHLEPRLQRQPAVGRDARAAAEPLPQLERLRFAQRRLGGVQRRPEPHPGPRRGRGDQGSRRNRPAARPGPGHVRVAAEPDDLHPELRVRAADPDARQLGALQGHEGRDRARDDLLQPERELPQLRHPPGVRRRAHVPVRLARRDPRLDDHPRPAADAPAGLPDLAVAVRLAPAVGLAQRLADAVQQRGGVRFRRARAPHRAGRDVVEPARAEQHLLRHLQAARAEARRPAPHRHAERGGRVQPRVQVAAVPRHDRDAPEPLQQLRRHRRLGLRGRLPAVRRGPALPAQVPGR